MNYPVANSVQENKNNLSIDWLLLVFLCLFTMDKVIIKPIALCIGLIWVIRRLKTEDIKSAPLFYILVPAIEVLKFFLLNTDFSTAHFYSFITGECYWLMCLLAFVVIYNRVKNHDTLTIHNTITAFFFINFIWSVTNLVIAMILSGTWNPYSSDMADYGNSTGDRITGLFMAPCYINAFFNSFATIYFLHKRKYVNSF